MLDILIPAVAGLISGAIGSLVAPWAQWGIEKKRKKHESRTALIASIREALKDPPSNQDFRVLPIYSQLRPHLSPKAISAVEGEYCNTSKQEVIIVCIGNSRHSGVNPYAQLVLDEVAALERSWDLL